MNTLTKNFVKRGLSLFLTVLLVFSLLTVGITSASAADVDVAPTGADTMTIYFRNDWKWTDICLYFWGSSTSTNPTWPGNKMTLHDNKGTSDVADDIYNIEIPTDITAFIINGLKDDNSGNRDQSPDITEGWKDGLGYYMHWDGANTVKTFEDYVVTTTLKNVEATVTTEMPAVIGTDVDIEVTYDFENSSNINDIPDVTLYYADGNLVEDTLFTKSGRHTPSVCDFTIHTRTLSAGEHSFYALVDAGDDLTEKAHFTFTLRNELSATLAVAPEEGYVNNSFVFTVTDNAVADGYGTPTYALYKEDGTLVEATWVGNQTTVVLNTTGKQGFYVNVTTDNGRTKTEVVYVQVEEFTDFEFTANYPTSVQATESIKITASLKVSVPYPVTYVLTNVENPADILYSTAENGGKFTISTDTTDIGNTKSYTLTAYAMVGDTRIDSTTTHTINVAVTEITETKDVTIYFKSTDTLGYAPYATVVGVKESKTGVPMEKAAYIVGNASGTAQYWWYSISIEVASTNPKLSFNVVSDRYDMEHTIEFEAVNSEYWFAVDNLNTNQTTDKEGKVYNYSLVDVSDWSVSKRNWTKSAAHMLWDDDVDGPWVENGTNSDKDTAEVASYKAVSLGDANGDGVVNIKDATYIQKVIAELETADSVSRVVSDVDGDNTVTIKDATAIQKKLVASL